MKAAVYWVFTHAMIHWLSWTDGLLARHRRLGERWGLKADWR